MGKFVKTLQLKIDAQAKSKNQFLFLNLITFRQYEPTLWPTSYSTSAASASAALLRWTFVLPLLFEGSLDRATARRSSPGVTASPRPLSFTLPPNSRIVSFRRLSGLSQTLFSTVHLYSPPLMFGHPQTRRGDGNVILFPAGFNIGFSGTSVILIEMWSPSSWNIQPQLKLILLSSVD